MKEAERPKRKGRAPRELKDRPLTPQQILFVEAYLIDFNGKAAAIKAGYKPKAASAQASDLLTRPNIQAEFQKRFQKKLAKIELTEESVLNEIARLSFSDARKLLGPNGEPLPTQEIDDNTAACIAGLEVFEEYRGEGEERVFVGYTKKYRLSSKTEALQMAGRYLKLFTDKHEVESKGGVLCIPVTAQTPEEWAKTHQGANQ